MSGLHAWTLVVWALAAPGRLPAGVAQTPDGHFRSTADGAAMVRIAGGVHTIGDADGRYDERPPVEVVLSPFLIDRSEVTNAQFERFVAASGYAPVGPWRRGYPPGGAELPVRFVTWHDAAAYARWARRRLPTEAEWEAAAGPQRWPWGPTSAPGPAVIGRGPDGGPTATGASPDVTARGAFHMGGNVREWVADWYDRYRWRAYAKSPVRPVDPTGPADGEPPEARFVAAGAVATNERSTRKVARGGGFASRRADNARRARRVAHNPRHWFDDVGFRCAVSLEMERKP